MKSSWSCFSSSKQSLASKSTITELTSTDLVNDLTKFAHVLHPRSVLVSCSSLAVCRINKVAFLPFSSPYGASKSRRNSSQRRFVASKRDRDPKRPSQALKSYQKQQPYSKGKIRNKVLGSWARWWTFSSVLISTKCIFIIMKPPSARMFPAFSDEHSSREGAPRVSLYFFCAPSSAQLNDLK